MSRLAAFGLGALFLGLSGCAAARPGPMPTSSRNEAVLDPFMAVNSTPTGLAKYFPNLPQRGTVVPQVQSKPASWSFSPLTWWEARHPRALSRGTEPLRGKASLERPPATDEQPVALRSDRIRSLPFIQVVAHDKTAPGPVAQAPSRGPRSVAARRPKAAPTVPSGSRDDSARQTANREEEDDAPQSPRAVSSVLTETDARLESGAADSRDPRQRPAAARASTISPATASASAVTSAPKPVSPVEIEAFEDPALAGRPRLRLQRPGSLPPDLPAATFPSTYYGLAESRSATPTPANSAKAAKAKPWQPRILRWWLSERVDAEANERATTSR
jgi:hypothetical protein